MDDVKQILLNVREKRLQPIYFLMGEEPYFIDKIADYIEESVLEEDQKGFNQIILYGKDVSLDEVIGHAKRYPMMSERQVVIVKEAQELSRSIENLVQYAEDPQPSTVLVFCYKYKKIDKRKKLHKVLSKQAVLYESKKLYENQVAEWIRKELHARKFQISPKAAQMLVEFLGTDLSKIDNELRKLQLVCPTGSAITPEIVEQNIGISKDYNNFELRKAIGIRDTAKAQRIVQYFSQNPKDNPMVLTVTLLFSFFSQLMQYHALQDQSKASVAKALKINPYFVSDYVEAARNYPMKKVSQIISFLRDADMKGKGVDASNLPQGDILKELLVKIMY